MENLFSTHYMPHGHCYFWEPEIVWAHAVSDSVIAVAYSVIPLALIHIVRKRRDLTYIWMGILFAVFIIGCGTTHIFDVINIWEPWYITDSIVRIITAIASIGTAIVLIKITPQILLIPNAEKWKQVNEDLFIINTKLLKSNEELTKTEQILKELNSGLEERVTERTREAIQKAEDFEFLADAIPQLIWTTDAEGKADYFNKRYLEYSGLTREEILHWGWIKIIHPDQYENVLQQWKQCLQMGKEYKIEFCMRKFDGEYKWFLVHGIPRKDKEGKIIQWFGTCTEIHDQKLAARELEVKNRDLSRINNDLDNFIYTASHDLKAPISNMEGLLNTIYFETKDQCTADVQQLFEMLDASIKRLKTTIDDLTDISRIQKNISSITEPVYVPEVLQEYEDNHKEQLERCRASITTSFDINTINFSKKNFRSIFYNLVNNAIKYHHPDRNPAIHISTEREGGFIVLKVADNGIGFDISQKGKIFGMFKRLHDHVQGSGVGLYIVKRIIENNNGKVDVESSLGVGSAFKVYFPDTTKI